MSTVFSSVQEKFSRLQMVMVCGNYCAGKSEFAEQHFKQAGFLRVNRKEIRRSLFEMLHFGEPWKNSSYQDSHEFLVKHTERKLIEQLLSQGKKVLVDNTSMDADSRKRYIDMARTAHATIGIVYLDVDAAECLRRNRLSVDPLAESVISGLAAHRQLPRASEGFQEIFIHRP